MKTYGKLDWSIVAGRIPLSMEKNPDLISHDKIAVLNTSDEDAQIEIVIFYEDEQPVGTYEIIVEAKRLRKICFNDLIDPKPIRLEKNYSCYIKSDIPVVVQFSRLNTGSKANAEMSTIAYPVE